MGIGIDEFRAQRKARGEPVSVSTPERDPNAVIKTDLVWQRKGKILFQTRVNKIYKKKERRAGKRSKSALPALSGAEKEPNQANEAFLQIMDEVRRQARKVAVEDRRRKKKENEEAAERPGASDELDLEQVFYEIDLDGSGTLEIDELGAALEKMGVAIDDEKLRTVYSFFDRDGSSGCDYGEFLWAFYNRRIVKDDHRHHEALMAGGNAPAAKVRRESAQLLWAERKAREDELRQVVAERRKVEAQLVGMGGGGQTVPSEDDPGKQVVRVRVAVQQEAAWPRLNRITRDDTHVGEVAAWKPQPQEKEGAQREEQPKASWSYYVKEQHAADARLLPLGNLGGATDPGMTMHYLSPSSIEESKKRRENHASWLKERKSKAKAKAKDVRRLEAEADEVDKALRDALGMKARVQKEHFGISNAVRAARDTLLKSKVKKKPKLLELLPGRPTKVYRAVVEGVPDGEEEDTWKGCRKDAEGSDKGEPAWWTEAYAKKHGLEYTEVQAHIREAKLSRGIDPDADARGGPGGITKAEVFGSRQLRPPSRSPHSIVDAKKVGSGAPEGDVVSTSKPRPEMNVKHVGPDGKVTIAKVKEDGEHAPTDSASAAAQRVKQLEAELALAKQAMEEAANVAQEQQPEEQHSEANKDKQKHPDGAPCRTDDAEAQHFE